MRARARLQRARVRSLFFDQGEHRPKASIATVDLDSGCQGCQADNPMVAKLNGVNAR
jgi:hypothetical protein